MLLSLLSAGVYAQDNAIENYGITLKMPDTNWSLAETQSTDDLAVFYYKRLPIQDQQGRQVVPNISIITENIEEMDVVTYSAVKRLSMPFDVSEVWLPADKEISYSNGIIYKGNYTDQFGQHTIIVAFLKKEEVGFRVICDVLTELYEEVEPDFMAALRSIEAIDQK